MTQIFADASWPYARRIAHRGAGKLAPENTLAAMRLGASLGYTMFEFDVQTSAEGELVLMHDLTVDRTTNGRGMVAQLSLRELQALDAGSWLDARFAGERIPTLAQVRDWLAAGGLRANIEIKPGSGLEESTGRAVALEVRQHWMSMPVVPLLSSFSEAALAAARDAAPELPRALLVKTVPDDWRQRCRVLGCVALDAHHAGVDASLVQAVHAEGMRMITYTVNDPERVLWLESIGVDAVITDAVDRIVA